MNYYKIIILLLVTTCFISSCNSDSDSDGAEDLTITITAFETSYDQVHLQWEIEKSDDIIIEDLVVYRTVYNDPEEFTNPELIGNLPSNETSFIDDEVPYYSEVIYTISLNYYYKESDQPFELFNLKSETQQFSRPLVIFDKVPFQIQKDPLQEDIVHILVKSSEAEIHRYNSNQNTITATKTLTEGWRYNNKFQIINDNQLFLVNSKGLTTKMNTFDYTTINTYQISVYDYLRLYSVNGDRIYFKDNGVLRIYDISSQQSFNPGVGWFYSYSEPINETDILYVYNGPFSSDAQIIRITPENCPLNSNCQYEVIKDFAGQGYNFDGNDMDPNILVWNDTKTQFISSIDGNLINFNDYTLSVRLAEITEKNYFHFAFDDENNIYASVQGEKIIHVFEHDTFELIDAIETKLYPLFPFFTSNGLYCIGSYDSISYWDYGYGNEFNFSNNTAIETF